ncbi:MAG: ATP-binding cassette domain-containing protein [Coprococcus sp.]
MKLIQIEHITKDYGNDRGVFDVSFEIEQGEVFGFLGPNGAGKTTTIRQLLGFIHPDKGQVIIDGKKVCNQYYKTNAHIGYLPGEINFPDGMKGMEFIRWCAELRGMKDLGQARQLIHLLDLKNADSDVKRMSKGMKQKIGIVCAFMHDPDILILDEPTSGLDPLMQKAFIDLIRSEKKRGKTILMSSHMFAEIEKTCDKTAIIRNGRIVAVIDMADIQKSSHKEYKIKFSSPMDSYRFAKENFAFSEINHEKSRVRVQIDDSEINRLIHVLSGYNIHYISEIKQTLEDYFMHFYDSRNISEWNDTH